MGSPWKEGEIRLEVDKYIFNLLTDDSAMFEWEERQDKGPLQKRWNIQIWLHIKMPRKNIPFFFFFFLNISISVTLSIQFSFLSVCVTRAYLCLAEVKWVKTGVPGFNSSPNPVQCGIAFISQQKVFFWNTPKIFQKKSTAQFRVRSSSEKEKKNIPSWKQNYIFFRKQFIV